MLRASSLAAVTIFVCSTSVNPSSIAYRRTAWRTLTTSAELRTGSVSVLVTVIRGLFFPSGDALQHLHPALDVQRGAHAFEREPELDQGDGDRGLHPHDDRLGVEDAGHGRGVREHAADERVDDVERRDVDQHGLGAVLDDARGEV